MVGFADETVVGEGESVGGRLRSAREAHGLSLDDIAARTRVPTRHLKAIEEDAYDQLPAAPYSVGFAKAFADAVGLNREEIGREFRAEKEGYGAIDAGPDYASEDSAASGMSGIVRLVLILLVVAAAAYGLWRSGLFGGSAPVATQPATPLPTADQPIVPSAEPATPAAADETANQSNDSTSESRRSNDQDETTGRSDRRKADRSDEPGAATPAADATEPAAATTPEREPPKTTRDLNMEAMKPGATAAPAAGPSQPTAAPPVIAPPAPPASPPAPSATP